MGMNLSRSENGFEYEWGGVDLSVDGMESSAGSVIHNKKGS